MPSDPLSRRALLRLDFGRRPAPPDPEPYKGRIVQRWSTGEPSLLRAWEPLATVLCDLAGVQPGDRVLDAGAGDGNVALEAARRGARVTACDLAPMQVARARARAEAAGADVECEEADVEALPYPDGSFDTVLSAYGVTFAPRPKHAARELLRVLAPGGLLVIAAPAPHSLVDRVLELSRARRFPSPALWGREEVARDRLLAAAPDTEVEVRAHSLKLEFDSERAAWAAFATPFGLLAEARDPFADLVAALSDSLARVEIDERVTLILARRGG